MNPAPGPRHRLADRGTFDFYLRLLEWLAIFSGVAVIVSKPAFCDEGWLMYLGHRFALTGELSNLFFSPGVGLVVLKPLVIGHALIGYLARGFDHYWLFRLPSLLLAGAGIACVMKVLRLIGVGRLVRLLTLALALAWFQRLYPGLVTARPEMLVFAVCAYALFALVKVQETSSHFWLAGASAALGFTVHPNAALAGVALLVAAPGAWRTMRRDLSLRAGLAWAGFGAGAIVLSLWILACNFERAGEAWQAFRVISQDPVHDQGLGEELTRYRMLLEASRLLFLAFVVGVAAAAAGIFSRTHIVRASAWTALLTLLALGFAGAKLPIYLVTALPALLVVSAHLFECSLVRVKWPALEAGYAALTTLLIFSTGAAHGRDVEENTLLKGYFVASSSHRDRDTVRAIIGDATLHANPQFFPFVGTRPRFVAYWQAGNLSLTPSTGARFAIGTDDAPEGGQLRHEFLYLGQKWRLWENGAPVTPSDSSAR